MAVDKVKPLKIETDTDGTQIDMLPTEANPSEDYLSSKGLAIENQDDILVDQDGSGNLQFTDQITGAKILSDLLDAEQENFDAGATDLVSTKTGPAIREVREKIASSASPGFSFGRSGAVGSGTWLSCETVPSNKAGRFVYITDPIVEKIFISNETIATFDVEIYEHEGDEVNLTLLSTHSVVSSRGGVFTVGVSCTANRQLALKVSSGSAKNIVAGLELSGTN